MKVELLEYTPLLLIANAIRYSRKTHSRSDTKNKTYIGKKDLELIRKVAFGRNHSSVLEHSLLTFDVECSAKCLLELSRHRIGVSMTVQSSRYTLRKDLIEFEKTGVHEIDETMSNYINKILELLEDKKNTMDDISMMLPASYIYKMQLTFNLRSLVNFLILRLDKSAHKNIRDLSFELMEQLPEDYKNLLKNHKKINELYGFNEVYGVKHEKN